MLDREAMRELIARPDEAVAEWCARHDIAEDALELVVVAYARDPASGAAASNGFRLGFDAAESRGVRGKPTWRDDRPRYTVQFVVVDGLDGTVMGPVVDDGEDADQLASFLNRVDWRGS